MLTKEKKKEIIDTYKTTDKDTGSTEVQIAILTDRIKQLSQHFETSSKDFSSKRGFLKIIAKRNKLLDYLKKTDRSSYDKLKKDLKL